MATTTDATDDLLPVPVDTPIPEPPDPHLYVEIRPAERRLDPYAVRQAFEQLVSFLRTHTSTSFIKRRRGTAAYPVAEFLLVADGRRDPTVRYLVRTNYLDLVEHLAGILRTCFPNSYEFDFVWWHPQYVTDFLPFIVPDADRDPDDRDGPNHPAITADHPYVAGVEFRARGTRRRDWMTPFTTFDDLTGPPPTPDDDATASARVPLSGVIDAMVDAEVPVIYQVVLRPETDWTNAYDLYVDDIQYQTITWWDSIVNTLFGKEPKRLDPEQLPVTDRKRLAALETRDPTRTFVLTARAVALTRDDPNRANAVAHRLSTALGQLDGPNHWIVPVLKTDDDLYAENGPPPGSALFDALCGIESAYRTYQFHLNHLPWWSKASKGIVAGVDEVPGFCLVDGAGLTHSGRRAIAARPTEREGLPLPPPAQLARYRPPGQALGIPLTHDRHPYDLDVYLPPADQDRHSIVVGPTGSGKSILTEYALLTNIDATAGPELLVDLKGGTAVELLQAHLARFGHLDDVLYFDCRHVLPALSVLDIGPLLAAGIPRDEASESIAGHYEEMLAMVMGHDRFYEAVEAPTAIHNHLRALFDPINGADHVTNTELYHTIGRALTDGASPPVTDEGLADYFALTHGWDRKVFTRVMGAASTRVSKIRTNARLGAMFDHRPRDDDPHFDFADVINESTLVIFDLGGIEDKAKRALTTALFSNLWRALQARHAGADAGQRLPLVNLYLEEAGAVGHSALLDTLLSRGRSFGLSVMLGVQFMGQLDSPDPESKTYEEALNETATIIAGQVATRDDLVHALATDAMPPEAVDRRLSRMPRGEWLVRPGAAFGAESVRPFLMQSLPAPPGHPASDEPLDDADQAAFDALLTAVKAETAARHGLEHDDEPAARVPDPEVDADPDDPQTTPRTDVAYPHSKRMPPTVAYRADSHALLCELCEKRYDPSIDGMLRAIACHATLDDIDRDDIPIGATNVKRSPDERAEEPINDTQFMFLLAVLKAMQGLWHPVEYDLRTDSMLRLIEYTGISTDELQHLLDLGLLTKDTDHPFRLYSVTAEGRHVLGEPYREGIDFGPGKGDLEESSPHIMGVRLGVDYLTRTYLEDPASPVTEVREYYDLGGNQRLDLAGLDAEGGVRIAVEVERVNHDVRRAVPEDFDKMAACEPDEALWIVMSHTEAHEILAALNDPLEGDPRVTKTYNPNTPAQSFAIDEPGMTGMLTIDQLRDRLGIDH